VLESPSVGPRAEDDGFHEIQLNGKQLVFVFMAATLLSVVIFLCGVLVGRGVQRERVVLANTDPLSAPMARADSQLDPAKPVVPPTVAPGSDPTKANPPTPASERTAGGRPDAAASSARADSKPGRSGPPAPPVPAAAPSTKPAPSDRPRVESNLAAERPSSQPGSAGAVRTASSSSSPPSPDASASTPTATSGNGPQAGWVVQVASVDARGEADAIAKRLSQKGYSTFILASDGNRYRVRVGGFKSRSEADAAAAQLRKEERIEPWVTR